MQTTASDPTQATAPGPTLVVASLWLEDHAQTGSSSGAATPSPSALGTSLLADWHQCHCPELHWLHDHLLGGFAPPLP